jgi:MFS family permease
MSEPAGAPRRSIVAAIGATQTIAWASSYYLPAILGAPIAASLGLSQSTFFGAFSAALLLSAALGPTVGRVIDRFGGRAVLALSHLVIAAGLVLLAASQGMAALAASWVVLGVGMAMSLYDPAFAALTRLYGERARIAITGVTLIAGFASTIGWPVTAALAHGIGWRGAVLFWALVNLLVAMPLDWFVIPPPAAPVPQPRRTAELEAAPAPRWAMPILAFYFAATWFITAAMAAHLPRLFELAGASEAKAIFAASLVGPAQVAARLFELGYLRRFHPLVSARLAAGLHPLGAGVLALLGAPGAVLFALLHGAGNGIVTIAKGTLPLALFGPVGYGQRNGILGVPARGVQAFAPLLFGLLLDRFGVAAVAATAALSLSASLSLFLLRARPLPLATEAVDG